MLLYFHIPYCDSKCSYCAFNSYTDRFDTRKLYMNSLKEQLLYELDRFLEFEEEIETIFIGGGTPSTIDWQLYIDIFETIEPYLIDSAEITTEANPNSASYEWLSGMKSLGVNRVSFGVQSFDRDKLKLLNRSHSPTQALKAIENAKRAGFEEISIDLIYGVAGDTRELIENDINIATTLPITHISAYELTIESNTPFASRDGIKLNDNTLSKFVIDSINERGFKQYEISNYGNPSKHNSGYWELKNYMGVGAGAVGFLKNRRYYPPTSIDRYINNPLDIEIEELSSEDIRIEKIFLGLRSYVGIDINLLDSNRVATLIDEGLIYQKQNRIYNRDYLLADEIALYLD